MLVICVARQGHLQLCLAENSQHADHLKVVGDRSLQIAVVGDLSTVIGVNDTGSENQARSRLVNADLAPIGHFLNQLKQVDFEGQKTGVAMVGPDIFDDDLATTEE